MYDNLTKYLQEHGIAIDQNKVANKTDIETKLRDTMASLQADIGTNTDTTSATIGGILGASNSTINSSPATYIKSLARMVQRNHRADIREIRLLLKDLATADTEQ